ncbi:hypothetical protein [Candidatus Viridilinea mediisalina]|uniref:Uncharacterized protein n=1 Tax=Candidatus Viridilinea mediisalina TaxID=2024553 RepID=A0A2A6RL06_9CHLR|nr:hypothetical protein [Candidatus Viridilinea mediisalina]PDW03757.1 hypothetical protein CJ255_07200 [Candidatus Viridilinea mediisalina]
MLSNEQHPVRPFDPARFVGQLDYGGATPIYVASLALHHTGEVVVMNLVGHDTAISAKASAFFLNKPIQFIPDEAVLDTPFWREPPLLKRLSNNYRQLTKKVPGIRNMANWIVIANGMRVKFNLHNPPNLPESAYKKPDEQQQQQKSPVVMQPAPPPVYRYVLANEGGMPSEGAFVGMLVGMRVVLLRPRRPDTRIAASQWAHALWQRGLERGLITHLPSLGVACWSILVNTMSWNSLVSEGVRDGWLSLPQEMHHRTRGTRSFAIAAD